MYKNILIPLDSSPTDEPILAHIRPLAKLTRAKLVLVHVADGFVARLQSQLNLADSEEIKKDRAYMNTQCKKLMAEGFDVKSILVQGKEPVDGILEIVKSENCDLIAMATHGHRFWESLILGSVADNLRRRTELPILMIRSGSK